MRHTVFLTLCLGLVMTTAALASPPVSIKLSYDLDGKMLHVEAVHPSFDLNKSYVRLVNVYVNGNQVSSQNYYRQNDWNMFSDDMPVTAHVGDKIKVELFCALGGSLSEEMTVSDKSPAGGSDQPDDSSNSSQPVSNTAS